MVPVAHPAAVTHRGRFRDPSGLSASLSAGLCRSPAAGVTSDHAIVTAGAQESDRCAG